MVSEGDGASDEPRSPPCATWWRPFATRFGLDRLRRVVVARGYPGSKFSVGFADQDGVMSAGYRVETLAEVRAYLRDLWRDNP